MKKIYTDTYTVMQPGQLAFLRRTSTFYCPDKERSLGDAVIGNRNVDEGTACMVLLAEDEKLKGYAYPSALVVASTGRVGWVYGGNLEPVSGTDMTEGHLGLGPRPA